MKKFLLKIVLFFLLIVAVFAIPLWYLPNIQYENSIMAALPVKHQMLKAATSPKIVFIGGSNLSMGLDSKKIADTFHRPVINNSIALWLGLKYMVNDVKPYINKGDVIVLSAEYNCYDESINKDAYEGYEALLSVLFDIDPQGKSYIDLKQWLHLLPFLPHYIVSEINFWISGRNKPMLMGMAGKKDFNQYGDLYTHWSQPKIPFKPEDKCVGNEIVNPDVIPFLKKFNEYVTAKGAKLVILPPPFQDQSFENRTYIISKIANTLKANDLPLIAQPSRYKFADKYMNDFPYHLTKAGVDIRTGLVIQDLSKVINQQK